MTTPLQNKLNISRRVDFNQRKQQQEELDGYGWTMSLDSVRTPEEILLVKERFARLERQIDQLQPRLGRVLRMRLGINCKTHTFEEIAEQYGVCRGRVQQIEAKATRILKRRIWIEEKPEDYRRQRDEAAKAYKAQRAAWHEAELAGIKAEAAERERRENERVAMDAERRQARAYGVPRDESGKFTSYLPSRYRAPPPQPRTILDEIVTEQKRALKLEREYTTWATERAKWLRSPMPDWATIKPYIYKMRKVPIKRDWLNVATEGFRHGA